MINSTFINNEFFNAPDSSHLATNNTISGNTFVNAGVTCMGGGELVENNIFKGNAARSYAIYLSDTDNSYAGGYSREQVFRGNLVQNDLSAWETQPSGAFGNMTLNSDNVVVEHNRFINTFNTTGDHTVFFANRSGYTFRDNEYTVENPGVVTIAGNGVFNFGGNNPDDISRNKISGIYYVSPADNFPVYKTHVPPNGNECDAYLSRQVVLEAGSNVFDIYLPAFGTAKVTVSGSWHTVVAEGFKEELFWLGNSGSARKLIYTKGNAGDAVIFTDVYIKNGRPCITGKQPAAEKQSLSVKVSFITDSGAPVAISNLEISGPYTDPGGLTFKSIYPGTGSGITANRPTIAANAVESWSQYFDTTLGKMIWFNGSSWIDANGIVV